MRLLDYLRLGGANIAAHKRRAVIVVVIVGVIFGVLMAGSMLIQGVENAALGAMLRPTDGKVWLRTEARQVLCEDECDMPVDQAEIRRMLAEAGGQEIAVREPEGMFGVYAVAERDIWSVIEVDTANAPEDAVPVLADVSTIASWLRISTLDRNASGEKRARQIAEMRERALGQVIEYSRQRYYVVGILPGGFGVSSLSLATVGDKQNPLNLLLDSVSIDGSETLVIDDGLVTAPTDEIWAEFADLAQAQAYIDAVTAQNCNPIEKAAGKCARVKDYVVTTVIGNPLMIRENFKGIWMVFKIFALVLVVVASIVVVSTYTRLVGRDTKVIALYHAMGATKCQVVGIYCVYLLELSLLAGVFSLILGVVLGLMINLLNMAKLAQVFTIGFGVEESAVWILGGNGRMVGLIGIILVLAPIATMLNLHQFSSKKLSQKMK